MNVEVFGGDTRGQSELCACEQQDGDINIMKYKTLDITVENLRKFKSPEVYKATYPKFLEFYIEKSKDEKSFFLKIWHYRLIVSVDRLIEARMAQVETEAKVKPIYQKIKPLYKKTDTNIIRPIYNKTGTDTVSKLLD